MIKLITKYEQVAEIIEQKIKSGEYIPGCKIPSERDLAKSFGISHMTVNKALACLVSKGVLKRVHGNGTFIVGDKDFISTKVVAIAIPADVENHPLFYPLLPNSLEKNGYFPIILNTQAQGVLEKFKKIVTQNLKSIIIEPLKPEFVLIEELKEYENVIFIHRPPFERMEKFHDERYSFIYSDYRHAGFIGARALLENRRKNILVLTYERIPGDIPDMFLSGCEMALKEYGGKLRNIDTNKIDENGYKELFLRERFDGILSLGDFRLIPVLKVLRNLSVSIPEDIQLIGMYNTPWAEILGITSISINQKEIIEEVLRYLEMGKRGYEKKIKPYIVFRNSCPKSERG